MFKETEEVEVDLIKVIEEMPEERRRQATAVVIRVMDEISRNDIERSLAQHFETIVIDPVHSFKETMFIEEKELPKKKDPFHPYKRSKGEKARMRHQRGHK